MSREQNSSKGRIAAIELHEQVIALEIYDLRTCASVRPVTHEVIDELNIRVRIGNVA